MEGGGTEWRSCKRKVWTGGGKGKGAFPEWVRGHWSHSIPAALRLHLVLSLITHAGTASNRLSGLSFALASMKKHSRFI